MRAAVLSSGLAWPLRRVTVNLAPSGVRKGGAGLDLPIAVGLLVATGELSPAGTEGLAFCGELGLNGSLRHVPGMIALADATAPLGLVVPLCDVREAMLVRGCDVRMARRRWRELARALRGQSAWPEPPPPRPPLPHAGPYPIWPTCGARRSGAAPSRWPRRAPPSPDDRAAGLGQDHAGRAAAGAAAAASTDEALTVTRIHSAAGRALPAGALLARPPFRAPHHQSSIVSLVGGGSWSLRPGEVSLATSKVRECTQTWRQLHQAGVYGQSTLATFCSRIGDTCCGPDGRCAARTIIGRGIRDASGQRPWLTWAVAAWGAAYGIARRLESVGGADPLRERQQHRPWDRKGAPRNRRSGTSAFMPPRWRPSLGPDRPLAEHLGRGWFSYSPTWPSIDSRNISP